MSDTWPAPEDDVPLIGEVPALPEGAFNKITWNAHPALAPAPEHYTSGVGVRDVWDGSVEVIR